MSLVLRRLYVKSKTFVSPIRNSNNPLSSPIFKYFSRTLCDDKFNDNPNFSNSTILIENGYNVQELPVVVKKLKDINEIDEKPLEENVKSAHDSLNYQLIQSEFRQCLALREVFSLLSKCNKITPDIALGAIERIYELEKDPSSIDLDSNNLHINVAKGAILDKLLKVVMKTEDTQTILNVLQTFSTMMEPYKYKFCDELLIRVIDKRLSIEQLCEFTMFLIKNKTDSKYSETIDKLWVGFLEKEGNINETNIVQIFTILPGLKASKKTIMILLEQKLSDHWTKIKVANMQEILNVFIIEKYMSLQSFAIVGRWLYINIHALDEDALLDIITKLTRLKYTDDQVEKAVEKYMKLKGSKIESQILIVGILNFCMQFQIRNKHILNVCSKYFLRKGNSIAPSFLKYFIYPYGFLYFDPKSSEFWVLAEEVSFDKFDKINANDLCSIILSCIYNGKYPLKLVNKMFSSEYLVKISNSEVLKKLHLIDTALSLECDKYSGPLLPKKQLSTSISQDFRIKNIIEKIKNILVTIAGDAEKLSTAVLIPNLCSNETYLIDVGMGSNSFNWKLKSIKNDNIAILIHLPDHYCSDNEQLVGPQVMRKKHLKLLGMKVVSLKYTILSQLYMSYNKNELKKYIVDNINNTESM